MKTFTFKLIKAPLKHTFARIDRAVTTGIVDINNSEMLCDSYESMIQTMSKARFRVFEAILKEKPESLSELARVLNSDISNISKNVEALRLLGLVNIEEKKTDAAGRDWKKPIALYDRIVFDLSPKKSIVNE